MSTWQVKSAKQKFSEVVRGAQAGDPQFTTKQGTTVAVVVSMDDSRRTQGSRPSLATFLLTGREQVALDTDLDLPRRQTDPDRIPHLFENDE